MRIWQGAGSSFYSWLCFPEHLGAGKGWKVVWLTKLFKKIIGTKKITDDWGQYLYIIIKEVIQSCLNYHVNNLISYTMKFWNNITKQGVRTETFVLETKFSFVLRRLTIEAIIYAILNIGSPGS